ncbi:hypothetical protein N5O88_10015 [Pseudomonas sp. GD03721]|nr:MULTISPECIES: hypothetical protein [unclassified Pseudomonas]MDH1440400.1 hypothetical protein [Pseudomonas sp. GD03722]WGG03512.1 hypothetical protein N5O88_10015 [Pseudomonas sp. GD03721]WGG07680.1 hypothetical protein N5O87_10025 [Pseudomonas sp. GD03919]
MSNPCPPPVLHMNLPVTFTEVAWQDAVLLTPGVASAQPLENRLRYVLRAAFEALLGYPGEPHVDFQMIQTAPEGHPQNGQWLQLRLSLIEDPDQSVALQISLTREHPQ